MWIYLFNYFCYCCCCCYYNLWSFQTAMHIPHLDFIDFNKVSIKSYKISCHSSKSASFNSWGVDVKFRMLKFGTMMHLTFTQSGSIQESKVSQFIKVISSVCKYSDTTDAQCNWALSFISKIFWPTAPLNTLTSVQISLLNISE